VPDVRPSLAHAASKTLARVRARGVGEIASLVRGRVREALWSHDRLLILACDTGGDEPEMPGLVLRGATAGDGQRYARDIGTDSRETFAARLSPQVTCWLVEEEQGRIVHATWMTSDGAWTRELQRCLRPPQGHGYVYESFTRADARGRGIYPFALRAISERVSKEGIARLWVGIENHNIASLRAVTKAGFEHEFEVSYQRRFGQLTVSASGAVQSDPRSLLQITPTCAPEPCGATQEGEQ
jgi:RimJ/RimL family protein N-acetyltransferase